MSEIEWLVSDFLFEMLFSSPLNNRGGRWSRKLHLFACASFRHAWRERSQKPHLPFVEIVENYSDGLATPAELRQVRKDAERLSLGFGDLAQEDAMYAAWYCKWDSEATGAKVLRHIIGNPFRPAAPPIHSPANVLDLAGAVYEGNSVTFALHDALLDAGLTELAQHFRDADEWHPKGCWAIDLILGKA